MHLKIPSDEAIGQHLRVIAQAVAVIAVAFYTAGYMLGAATYWLSANFAQLPAHAINQLTTDHASTHPPVPYPNGNHRFSDCRSRQPKSQSNYSEVEFS